MSFSREDIHNILKQYWGYDNFRELQEDIILSILSGNNTLALMPTGGGKSICFQVPGMVLEHATLVISPLIALINDQVINLQKKAISAASITSAMPLREQELIIQKAINGEFKFLYISPERLESTSFQKILNDIKISLLVIDEAHCISQWGYDFRPSYLKIAEIKKHLYNPNIPCIALTASANNDVIKDIIEKLALKNTKVFKMSFARKNLRYIVLNEENKFERTLKVINKVKGSGIIYIRSRNKTKELSDWLNTQNISADYFHAGLHSYDKYIKQQKFINNEFQVMVATNAFGMGIDKPDVRFVINWELSDSIESYFQEAGRGGRDLKTSYAILFFTQHDKENAYSILEQEFPNIDDIKKAYISICNFYEIPIREGEGRTETFDLKKIAELYNIKPITLAHALKFLELNEYIEIQDERYEPSKCMFNYENSDIYRFYVSHPEYEEILKTLLRTYGGILSNYIFIDESALALKLRRSKQHIINELTALNKFGVLSYHPITGLPKIIFLKDRLNSNDIKINQKLYDFLKDRKAERLNSLVNYATQTTICRQQFLLTYFGETDAEECGHCDICITKKQSLQTTEIKNAIILLLTEKENLTIHDICVHLSKFTEEKIISIIRQLIDDNVLEPDNQERLQIKNRK